MVEQFEATEQDSEIFEDAENKILKIVIAYIETYGGTPVLPNYPRVMFPKDAYVEVEYVKPNAIQSDAEKLSNIQTRLEMGLITKIDAIAIDQDLDREQAIAKSEEINAELGGGLSSNLNGAQMKSINDLVANVSLGIIPRDSALQIISLAFGIDEVSANKLMSNAGQGFVPTEGAKVVE
jgi:hypothetical protein